MGASATCWDSSESGAELRPAWSLYALLPSRDSKAGCRLSKSHATQSVAMPYEDLPSHRRPFADLNRQLNFCAYVEMQANVLIYLQLFSVVWVGYSKHCRWSQAGCRLSEPHATQADGGILWSFCRRYWLWLARWYMALFLLQDKHAMPLRLQILTQIRAISFKTTTA